MTELLTNPRSERVRSVARLSGRSARRRSGRFLAEGPSCVREALAVGAALDVYATDEALARHPDLSASVESNDGARLLRCTDEVLAAMADTVTPQGVLATAALPSLDPATVFDATPRLVVILAHVRDPGNAGTVIRAADAVGADAVLLTESSVDPFNPKCVRATTGSIFHLPVLTGPTLAGAVGAARDAGLLVLAADGAGDDDLDALLDDAQGTGLTGPTAWVFGNEAWGMTPGDRALADRVVRVPIRGRAESLNLAMAATVCLYASSRVQPRTAAAD